MNNYTCDISVKKAVQLKNYLNRNNIRYQTIKVNVANNQMFHFVIVATAEQGNLINEFINTTYFNG